MATASASAAPTAGNLWHATAGYPFDLTIEGIAMSLDDRIRVVASAQFCGVDGAQNISTAIADASTTGEAQESVGTANNLTSLTWTGIVLTRVEELRVCWCNGTLSDCSEGVHFDTSLGRIATDGLSNTDVSHMCYLRSDCVLQISGSGLVAEDALIISSIDHDCGDTGSLVALRLSIEGGGFETDDSGYMYIGTFAGSTETTQRWTFDLGPPITTAKYRVCYCNARRGFCVRKQAFDISAGELVVRGTEVLADAYCEQGASCSATLRSVEFHQQDAILLHYYSHQCGDSSPAARPSWSTTIFPESIEEYVFSPGLWDATFPLLVAQPGQYRICYCAHVDDPSHMGCHDGTGNPIVSQFSHDSGRVRVQGIVESVSEVTSNETGALPGSPASLTVEVVSQSTGVRITCAATPEATTGNYVPLLSDVQNCTVAEFLLPGGSSDFPRCWGVGTTPNTAEQGTNLVHIPLASGLTSGALPDDMHVWSFHRTPPTHRLQHSPTSLSSTHGLNPHTVRCYSDFPCSNDRCVTPASSAGTIIRITRGIVVSSAPQEVLVGTPFAWRLELTSSYDIGEQWPRIKVIQSGRNCRSATLYPGTVGLSGTCEASGIGKCEPQPQALWTTGVGGSMRELVWSDIVLPEVGEYDVCYCDRHYAQSCALWQYAGGISASGPLSVGQYQFASNPGDDFVVFVEGSELTFDDRIMVRFDDANTQTTTTTETTAQGNSSNSSRRLTVATWFSGRPFAVNETGQFFNVRITITGNYEVYWCSGTAYSCQMAWDFTVYLGPLSVAVRVDCELTDWWIATSCTEPCGGGKILKSRAILTEAQAGGTPCPDELSELEDCNIDACPLADIRSMNTLPDRVVMGEAFAVVLEGDWLNPDEDWVLIVEAGEDCGTANHHGGAQCNEQGGGQQQLVCGNGRSTIRIDTPGQYRVCVCDGSAAVISTQQGDHVVGLAGNLSSVGCESPLFFQISPEGGGFFDVHASAVAVQQAEADSGLQEWHIVLIFSSSLVLILLMLAACWAAFGKEQMQQMRAKRIPDIEETPAQEQRQLTMQQRALEAPPPMHALPAPAPTPEPQQRMDMQTLAWYEAHYQALGYPPGTAYMQFGHLVGNPQLALTNEMNPMPSTSMPLMQQQTSWNSFNPPAMSPLQLPALMPPPTPPILPAAGTQSPRSAMARPGSSTFADRATEANKRPATPPGAVNFRNLDLSPMPSQRGGDTTPRADSTPHGDATPRGSPPAPFTGEQGGDDAQSEDGAPAPLRGHFRRATSKEERPATGNSLQSATSFVLSESSNESPRLTTSALKAHDSAMGTVVDRMDKMENRGAPPADPLEHAVEDAQDEVIDIAQESPGPQQEVPQPPDVQQDDETRADELANVEADMEEAAPPVLPPEPPQPLAAPSDHPPDAEEASDEAGRNPTDTPQALGESRGPSNLGETASSPLVIPGLPLGAGPGPPLPPEPRGSVSGMALPPPPPPPKVPGPGPKLQLDQFEETMHSTASDNPWERSSGSNAVPDSPLSGSGGGGGRKTFSLAGLAKSQGAAASKLPRSPTGASHSQHKPKKPVISTRSPQQFAKPEMVPPPPPSELPGPAQPSAARGSTQTSFG